MDEDLDTMTLEELKAEVKKYRAGIRQHRDATGHNLCWFVPELWNLLPEQVDPKPQVPPTEEFINCCKAYRKSLDKLNKIRNLPKVWYRICCTWESTKSGRSSSSEFEDMGSSPISQTKSNK